MGFWPYFLHAHESDGGGVSPLSRDPSTSLIGTETTFFCTARLLRIKSHNVGLLVTPRAHEYVETGHLGTRRHSIVVSRTFFDGRREKSCHSEANRSYSRANSRGLLVRLKMGCC